MLNPWQLSKNIAENNGLPRPLPRRCYSSASPGAPHVMRLPQQLSPLGYKMSNDTSQTSNADNNGWPRPQPRRTPPIPELLQHIRYGISQPAITGKNEWHRPLPRRTPPIRQSPKWLIHGTSRTNFAEYNGLPRPLPRSCYPSASPGARLRLLTSIAHKLCDCLPLGLKERLEVSPPLKASP